MGCKGESKHILSVGSSIFSCTDTTPGKQSQLSELGRLVSESWNEFLDNWVADDG